MTLFSLSVDDQNDYLKLGLAWEASVLREAIPIVFMNMVRFILLEIKLKSLLKFQLKFICWGNYNPLYKSYQFEWGPWALLVENLHLLFLSIFE